ncbi:MAG: flagellar motor protein MotD [Pseudomonadota bacterium]
MARKKYREEPDNHDRWMVSYADFITLLLAFFVVMYAVSSVNQGKYRMVSHALGSAFSGGTPVLPLQVEKEAIPLPVLPSQKQRARQAALRREREQMTGMARELMQALSPLVGQGKVRVTQNSRGVSVEINASVLFAPADARLGDEAGVALKAVAQVLLDYPHALQVEGHTDDVPITSPMFPSNWELSAVRAGSVVRLFIEQGIAGKRLVAIGHGPNQPVASNESAEGRTRNRRVQVMILSGIAEQVTEVTVK